MFFNTLLIVLRDAFAKLFEELKVVPHGIVDIALHPGDFKLVGDPLMLRPVASGSLDHFHFCSREPDYVTDATEDVGDRRSVFFEILETFSDALGERPRFFLDVDVAFYLRFTQPSVGWGIVGVIQCCFGEGGLPLQATEDADVGTGVDTRRGDAHDRCAKHGPQGC